MKSARDKLHFLVFLLCLLAPVALAAGTWTQLAHAPPGPAGHFLVLPDGTVMAESLGSDYGPGWFRLVPDSHGSYANGTWTNMASMNFTRLDFDSLVLTNGKVLVAGGEYGTGGATAEIYDLAANTWTTIPVPTSVLDPTVNSPQFNAKQGFSDADAIVLSNGLALFAPVAPNTKGGTVLFNPGNNTWSLGPTSFATNSSYLDEASWVQLADGSVLVINNDSSKKSERYIPSLNTWIADATAPVLSYSAAANGRETGPAVLLPNGNAIFFGGNNNTLIYTPTGNTNPGSWTRGPNFPNSQGMPDAPAAMLVNGKILCLTAQAPTNSTIWYPPCSFYEYDYVNNAFTQVTGPTGDTFNGSCWPTLFCALPDGTVLFGHRSTDFYIYQPDGSPIAAGKPTVAGISINADGSLHISGKLFNGISTGASYGDDEQMDSNFPLVRFTDTNSIVRYGRTYNWSGSPVMTGNTIGSTECAMPAGASLADSLQVVVNGFASDPVSITANTPAQLTAVGMVGNGSFKIVFTNTSVASFRVLVAPDITWPLTNWIVVGAATETPIGSGQYQFIDLQATNGSARFYRVKSP